MTEQKSLLSEMSVTTKVSLVFGVAVIFGIAIALVVWINKIPHESVFTGAGREDIARAVQELHSRNIEYRISEDGLNIQVQTPIAATARMVLADLGLPFDNTVGLEVFETSDFGVTEFAQRINYKRALEGELMRTISAMAEVRYARVHLVLPEKALLKANSVTPSAAITLFLRKDTQLSPVQISGIQSLVEASVPGLNRNEVMILNQSGQQLSASATSANKPLANQVDHVEQVLLQKIESLLAQRFYSDQFRVTVNADIETKSVHRIEERPIEAANGEAVVLKRISSSEYTSEKSKPSTKLDESYALGQLREEVTIPGGQVVRLSIAVWITASLSAEEQTEIEQILNASVGIRAERGDRLVVLVSESGLEEIDLNYISKESRLPREEPEVQIAVENNWQGQLQELPIWVFYIFGALVFLIVLLLFILILVLRGASQARLSKKQREVLLKNLSVLVQE